MGNLEKGHSEAARPTQAVGWPHLFLAVPLKAVRATGGSSRQPPRCWSTVGGQRLPPPPEPSQERKGLGKVATPPCIPASQQRLPNWTSSCVATEGRVGRIRDPLSFWGDNVQPYRGWQVQPWVGAFMVRDRRFRGGGLAPHLILLRRACDLPEEEERVFATQASGSDRPRRSHDLWG